MRGSDRIPRAWSADRDRPPRPWSAGTFSFSGAALLLSLVLCGPGEARGAVVVSEAQTAEALSRLSGLGEKAFHIGSIESREEKEEPIQFV